MTGDADRRRSPRGLSTGGHAGIEVSAVSEPPSARGACFCCLAQPIGRAVGSRVIEAAIAPVVFVGVVGGEGREAAGRSVGCVVVLQQERG